MVVYWEVARLSPIHLFIAIDWDRESSDDQNFLFRTDENLLEYFYGMYRIIDGMIFLKNFFRIIIIKAL